MLNRSEHPEFSQGAFFVSYVDIDELLTFW
jgi:hypothetical protein